MPGFSGNIKSEDVLLDKVFQCILPYTGKLSRELVKIWFSWRKLSRIARFCSTKGRHALNFAEKTFAYSHKTEKFTKVFSLESFLWYGTSCLGTRLFTAETFTLCTYVKISAVNSLVPRLRPVNTNRQLILVLKHLGNLYHIEWRQGGRTIVWVSLRLRSARWTKVQVNFTHVLQIGKVSC